jgi:hypothetical protein
MKQAQILAMRSRQRSARYEATMSGDISGMSTEELRGFIAWLDYQLRIKTGARYAHLSLLDDMAREELAGR